jgi:hypothetical protein
MSTSIEELPQSIQNTIQPQTQMTPSIVNQLLNDINEASIKGDTQLLPRDIPMQTEIDEESKPNYIPNEGEKYIDKEKPTYRLRGENMDKIYDEIQLPILLAIIYFLFQLPIFRNFMFNAFPFMFSKDGNSNIQGYFGFSIMFGLFYYIISKIIIMANF